MRCHRHRGFRNVSVPDDPSDAPFDDRPKNNRGDVMKRKLEICVLALALIPGLALAGSPTQISELAAATGLNERDVQMVMGAHTAYPQYLTRYDWARRRIVSVLGTERFDDLMAGREIRLDNGTRVAIAK
jgi:hypothetical protein